jgi:hypothetical protein
MVQIKVIGRCTRISKKLVRQAVSHYVSLIFSSRLAKNINIEIQFKRLWKNEQCLGSAYPEQEEENGRPRHFVIELDSEMNKKRILMTLAHETTHVKQYAMGQLKYYTRVNKMRWLDEVFESDYEIKSDKNYWFSGWEIEAAGHEQGLYVLFKQHLREEKRLELKKKLKLNKYKVNLKQRRF